MALWYYVDRGQNRQGPMELEALRQAFALRRIDDTSLVWREGLAEWTALGQLRDELEMPPVAPLPDYPAAPAAGPVAEVPAKRNNGCLIAAIVVGGGLFLVFALAVVAAIALPAYQDYIGRSKVVEARMLGQGLQLQVEEFVQNTDRCPRDAAELQLAPPSGTTVSAVTLGEDEAGRCFIELQMGGVGVPAPIVGLSLRLSRDEAGDWYCTSDQIATKHLPADCR